MKMTELNPSIKPLKVTLARPVGSSTNLPHAPLAQPTRAHAVENVVYLESESKLKGLDRWASREGLIVLSLVLIFIFIIMEIIFGDTWSALSAAFQALSGVIFLTFIIIAVLGAWFLIKLRSRVWAQEREGLILFIIGTMITVLVPIARASAGEPPEVFFGKYNWLLGFGTVLVIFGAIVTAWFGGFFTVWFFGLVHYLVMSSHEAFLLSIYTHHYGPYDQFYSSLGLALIIVSVLLLIYHELKFFYLGKLIRRGIEFRNQGRYRDALKPLQKALRLYPRYATAWNNKGNVLYNLGRYSEAVSCYDKALAFAPEYQMAAKNRALAAQRVGR
jgi:hypothetical protein